MASMRYEKGRKEATQRRILDVAAEQFRNDGIAASGLAGIMKAAGLTNGAFYPHFDSKADLVRKSLEEALDGQARRLHKALEEGGLEGLIAAYLSAEHRDHPGNGCVSAALLPEIARQPAETRDVLAERLLITFRQLASTLPPETENPESVAFGLYATLIGTLQLARATRGTELSDRILAAGADSVRVQAEAHRSEETSTQAP